MVEWWARDEWINLDAHRDIDELLARQGGPHRTPNHALLHARDQFYLFQQEESDDEQARHGQRATQSRKTTAERVGFEIDMETCAICLDSPCEPTVLPCGHVYCGGCMVKLRETYEEKRRPCNKQRCPICRAELPPDGKRLADKAIEIYSRIDDRVQRGEASGSCSCSWMDEEQHRPEKGNMVAMLVEAAAAEYPHLLARGAEVQMGDADAVSKKVVSDADLATTRSATFKRLRRRTMVPRRPRTRGPSQWTGGTRRRTSASDFCSRGSVIPLAQRWNTR